jgi:VWFA-related protein
VDTLKSSRRWLLSSSRNAALLLCAVAIPAQQSAPPADVVIRTTTSLVEVRVVAVDSAGHPVTDLRQQDFQIFDNSKPQPIKLFSPSRSEIAPPSAGATPSAPGEAGPTPPGSAVLLLDWLNTGYPDRLRVQENVLRLLKNFQPRQNLGIYVLSRHTHLLVDFTTDRDILAALVERIDLDAQPAAAESKVWTTEARVKETVRTVNLIAGRLLHLPGRKSLIWLTAGFPMLVPGRGRGAAPVALFFQDIEKNLAKLNAADVAVYSIDATGLRMMPNFLFDTTREISTRTGGTAFSDRNDLDEGIRLALEDAAASYTLGFHVPDHARGGLHAINVRVDRHGIKLRYRETYDPSVANR